MIRAVLLLMLLGSAAAMAQGVPNTIPRTGPGNTSSDADLFGLFSAKRDYTIAGLAGDGVTDDGPVIQAALTARAAAGGGPVAIAGAGRYLINSANLAIPRNVTLTCEAPMMGEQAPTENWLAAPCALIVNPAYTVQVGQQASLSNFAVMRKGLVPATSMRTAVQSVAAFAGTGVTITGIDAHIDKSMVVGFATCIADAGFAREMVLDLGGDCTAGMTQDNSHDISRYTRVEIFPYATGTGNYVSWANNGTYAIQGLANNGAGLIRVTFTPGVEAPVTGDLIAIYGVKGVPQSVTQRYTVTVIDDTHFDLQGSAWPGTFTTGASSTSGSPTLTAVTSASGLGVGMAMTGGNFPANTTITAINLIAGSPMVVSLTMSANAMSTVAGGSYNFVPVSTVAGTGAIDTTYRSGKAFAWTNGENNTCDHCFEFGHQIGYYFGVGSLWTELTASSSDALEYQDPNTFGMVFDVGSADGIVHGGYFGSKGRALYMTNGPGPGSKFSGVSFNVGSAYSPALQFVSGPAILSGCSLAPLYGVGSGSIVLGSDPSKVIFSGNDFGATPISGVNDTAAARVIAAANNSGAGP